MMFFRSLAKDLRLSKIQKILRDKNLAQDDLYSISFVKTPNLSKNFYNNSKDCQGAVKRLYRVIQRLN
jgi:hypothetical protein